MPAPRPCVFLPPNSLSFSFSFFFLQRAAKFAIRENIEKDMERRKAREAAGLPAEAEGDFDPVPAITARHFEAAMRDARRSVSDADLARYSSFASTLQQQRAAMGGGQGASGFSFGSRAAGGGGDTNAAAAAGGAEEDDLYS
jgi:transitional endoplasmic reticulum ATPase